MIYLLEQRKTVGAFKTIAASSNFKYVYSQFTKTVENITGGNGKGAIFGMSATKQKKYPDILRYFKVGSEHYNVILRIRQIEED